MVKPNNKIRVKFNNNKKRPHEVNTPCQNKVGIHMHDGFHHGE